VVNWLERARLEFSKRPDRGTAITAERNLTSVTAVRHPGESANFATSDSRLLWFGYRFRLHGNEGGGL
jgi:hypothetical protein